MAETLSVRERIMVKIVANLTTDHATWTTEEVTAGRMTAAQKTASSVRRMNWAAGLNLNLFDIVVDSPEDTAAEGPQGDVGNMQKIMPLWVGATIRQPEDDSESSDKVFNRWIARLEKSLTSSALSDATGFLTHDVIYRNSEAVDLATGQGEFMAAITVDIYYRTTFGDPYTAA